MNQNGSEHTNYFYRSAQYYFHITNVPQYSLPISILSLVYLFLFLIKKIAAFNLCILP